MATVQAAPLVRLRQWFDDSTQVHPHFQRRQSDEAFFFAGPELPRNTPVLLEVAFRSCDQVCTLRGRATDIERGGKVVGTWLSFAIRALVKGLIEAASSRRRDAQRVCVELPINARFGAGTYVCRMVDIGPGGARISGLRGVVLPGMRLDLSLFGKPSALGEVDAAVLVWQRDLDAGVRFLRRDPPARMAVSRLLQESKASWRAALEAQHPSSCACSTGGARWEPPAPAQRMELTG